MVNTAGAEGACKNIYRVYSPKLDVDYRTAYLLSSFLELRRSGYWPNSATPAVEWVSLEDRRSQMDDAIERWLQLSLHGTLDAISGQKEHEIAGVVREVLSETVAELRDLGVHLEKIEKNEPSAGIDVIEAEIFDNEFYEVLSEAAALLGSANEDLKSRSAAIDERLAKLEMSVDE